MPTAWLSPMATFMAAYDSLQSLKSPDEYNFSPLNNSVFINHSLRIPNYSSFPEFDP